MTTPKTTPIDRWYARRDAQPTVERWKARVRGKPRGTKQALHRQRTLGTILLALGRQREALAVLDEAASAVTYSGKGDPWFLASTCAALAAWQRGEPLPAKFVQRPAHAVQDPAQAHHWTAARVADSIAAAWRAFEAAKTSDDTLAVDTMAFHLAAVALFRVLGVAPARATDRQLQSALDAIATRSSG